MTFAAILTLTRFRAIRAIVVHVAAFKFASITFVAAGAQALPVELIACTVVYAIAFVRTVPAPEIGRACCVDGLNWK